CQLSAVSSAANTKIQIPFPKRENQSLVIPTLERTQGAESLRRTHGNYRLLNWKRLRAPFCPYFLRSLPRESRLTMPSAFSFFRNSELNCIRARAMPNFTASALPRTPPPSTLAITLNV